VGGLGFAFGFAYMTHPQVTPLKKLWAYEKKLKGRR
jgi:hypothetical protein